MDAERPSDEDGPFYSWLPPEDRLWRHPSEAARELPRRPRRWLPQALALRSISPQGWRYLAVAVVGGLVGAAATLGAGAVSGLLEHQASTVGPLVSAGPGVTLADAGDVPGSTWNALAEQVAPSVVAITVCSSSCSLVGSGVVLFEAGRTAFVLTDRNLFSAALNAQDLTGIEVTFPSGRASTARLVGTDPLTSLALVEATQPPGMSATPAQTGTVANLNLADPVMVLGAQGTPGGSVFLGSISGEADTVNLAEGQDMDNLLAVGVGPTNQGVDGGPVVDQFGQVVGITVDLVASDPTSSQGVTYAVPIDEARQVAMALAYRKSPPHPWIGVSDLRDVPSSVSLSLGLAEGGAQAGQVAPNSPARRAGLTPGDVITSLNGRTVGSAGELSAALSSCAPGKPAAMTFEDPATRKVTSTTVLVANEPPDQ